MDNEPRPIASDADYPFEWKGQTLWLPWSLVSYIGELEAAANEDEFFEMDEEAVLKEEARIEVDRMLYGDDKNEKTANE